MTIKSVPSKRSDKNAESTKASDSSSPAQADSGKKYSDIIKAPPKHTTTSRVGRKLKHIFISAATSLMLFSSLHGADLGDFGSSIEHPRVIFMGAMFAENTDNIELKVKAIPQSGVVASGCLVNGLTDDKWFQLGLGYVRNKFYIIEEIWDSNNRTSTSNSLIDIDCNSGDTIMLKLHITKAQGTNNTVTMEAQDLDNGKKTIKTVDTITREPVFQNYHTPKGRMSTGIFTELHVDKDKFNEGGISRQTYELIDTHQNTEFVPYVVYQDYDKSGKPTSAAANDSEGIRLSNQVQSITFPDAPKLILEFSKTKLTTGSAGTTN